MKIVQNEFDVRPLGNALVQVKKLGNVTEVRYMTKKSEMPITKINADGYVVNSTGEYKEFNRTETRAESKANVSQSLKRLRDILNTNVTDSSKSLWLTLTYDINMRDPVRLYNDFKNFNKRLRYYMRSNVFPEYEYIVCCEPQSRGAWHCHVVLIFESKAPYIPNSKIATIWAQGFTKTKSLKDVTNVGIYLTAYMTDIELSELPRNEQKDRQFKMVEVNDNGQVAEKRIVKGGRLHFYPKGFRIYRTS